MCLVIVHIKVTMVSVPVHVFASSSNCGDLAFRCFSWVPSWNGHQSVIASPSTCCWGNANKAMSKGGSCGGTSYGALIGMKGKQGLGARFPQKETKRKPTKGRDRPTQAPQTGPLCCKNRALNFTKLREGRDPGVKHSLCDSVEESLTEHTEREKPHTFIYSNIYYS